METKSKRKSEIDFTQHSFVYSGAKAKPYFLFKRWAIANKLEVECKGVVGNWGGIVAAEHERNCCHSPLFFKPSPNRAANIEKWLRTVATKDEVLQLIKNEKAGAVQAEARREQEMAYSEPDIRMAIMFAKYKKAHKTNVRLIRRIYNERNKMGW